MAINLDAVTVQDCKEDYNFKGMETVIRAGRVLGFTPTGVEWDWNAKESRSVAAPPVKQNLHKNEPKKKAKMLCVYYRTKEKGAQWVIPCLRSDDIKAILGLLAKKGNNRYGA